MKTNYRNSRREWLKKGAIAAGALAFSPYELWSAKVHESHIDQQPLMFKNALSNFNEFTPPKFPDLSTVKARLVWNENPYGPSSKASAAFQQAVTEGNHYSWGSLGKLVKKIAQKEGVETKNIMMGPGSSDLLEKTAMVYFRDGGNVISGDPCYMSLVHVAKASGGDWKPIKLTKDFQHDLDAMEAAIDSNTKLIYITNPNNPTATLTDTKKLYDFCDRVSDKVPIFIDEAYIELSAGGLKSSMAPLVAKGKNIFVARTFSKIYGMAGLRIGYMLGNEKSLEAINQITRGGMGITGPTIAAANASLDDVSFIEDCKSKITSAKKFTYKLLDDKGIKYLPSETNFILFPIEMDGDEFLDKIYEYKVVVRAFKFWDQNWCRVSMGTQEEMEYFAAAINKILV
ncbi:pyridoxal phosphate-dependent aminotransferase [Galbibacter pacificus]|uniref:Histidinol-phosphate transaminase n=1 Tax=Galbibacter pacificus TaxID=2996052 RepID=A0ABT6FTQ1_9FLAO|nr:histidinol-phosphate transaminase [Galbibacter pacificus]MDG3583167.1 histidinol-phosphate transaminase [Galbibacter pacificus]MDG3586648.1 histidinol-phosphate transaminase [Galbibacter pacificus]